LSNAKNSKATQPPQAGRRNKGTPQGGVLSPLLANICLNALLKGKAVTWIPSIAEKH
jgi:retron-type reverse transcriptase